MEITLLNAQSPRFTLHHVLFTSFARLFLLSHAFWSSTTILLLSTVNSEESRSLDCDTCLACGRVKRGRFVVQLAEWSGDRCSRPKRVIDKLSLSICVNFDSPTTLLYWSTITTFTWLLQVFFSFSPLCLYLGITCVHFRLIHTVFFIAVLQAYE